MVKDLSDVVTTTLKTILEAFKTIVIGQPEPRAVWCLDKSC
jgi:hypothetical protein